MQTVQLLHPLQIDEISGGFAATAGCVVLWDNDAILLKLSKGIFHRPN